jgi:hypothetical protein
MQARAPPHKQVAFLRINQNRTYVHNYRKWTWYERGKQRSDSFEPQRHGATSDFHLTGDARVEVRKARLRSNHGPTG